jgi:hypothetical protein
MRNDKNSIQLTRRALLKMGMMVGAAGIITDLAGFLPAMASRPLIAFESEGKFPADSNAIIRYPDKSESGYPKAEVIFPRGDIGYMKHDRFEFIDNQDFIDYLSKIFPAAALKEGLLGEIKRTGSYVRIDDRDRPIFTFGDPILDLITNEDGILVIGSVKYNMKDMELADPDQRGGGIAGDDLRATNSEKPKALKASYAQTALPSEIWFPSPNEYKRMRFRAFRRNYLAYWRVGADITTKHRDFTFGAVSCRFGASNLDNGCTLDSTASDSDADDNYVACSFWATGNVPIFGGVNAICTADWGGVRYSDIVQKGCGGQSFV